MGLGRLWSRKNLIAVSFLGCAMHLFSTPALSQTAATSSVEANRIPQARLYLAQSRECSQRAGPFVTQSTAWQTWREAQSRGYAVSNGVVPCYDSTGSRGYCFFVYFRC
jgi:hypothetical protein